MDELVKEFQAEYKERGNRDLDYQVPYLASLAHKYQQNGDWASILRAHALFNSCAVRDKEKREQWLENAFQMQLKYWQADLQSFPQHLELAKDLKFQLEEIRAGARRQLKRISDHFENLNCDISKLACAENQELYIQILHDIPHLSNTVNQQMIGFSRSVVEKALGIYGTASSRLCVVALGSMARGEMTPYSDLEFLFLTDTKSEEVINYLERLAVTIYFLIGNLCETKLKVMAIPELMTWDDTKGKFVAHWFDDAGMSGFKIDGLGSWAGNIPTGGTPEQKNQFICTVDDLVERYKTVFDDVDMDKALTGDLTAMLANTAFISGDQRLHDRLREKINAIDPNEQRKTATVNMLRHDAEKFDFKPDKDLTQKRHMKSDIYRYPSILTLNLKILHQIPNCNPWEIIDRLEDKCIISDLTAKCLRFSFCCALFIRLSAYLYHNTQDESISVLSSNQSENLYKGAWYVRPQLLTHMFIHLVPLKEGVSKVSADPSKRIDLEITERSQVQTLALVAFHCEDYQKVLSELKKEFPDGPPLNDSLVRKMFLYSAIQCNECAEAEILTSVRITQQVHNESDFFLLGRAYEGQCRFSDALDAYKARLFLLIKKHDEQEDHPDVAQTLADIGVIFMKQARFDEAMVQYRNCLEMRERLYKGKDHIQVANILNNMATLLHDQSKYEEALKEFRKCLAMRLRLFGDRDHVRIADDLCNIGSVLDSMGLYDEALVEYKRSLEMSMRIYEDQPHSDIADTLCNIGVVLYNQGKLTEAITEYRKCLDLYVSIHKGSDQMVIAHVLCNIGAALSGQGKHSEALVEYQQSLAMRRKIYGERNHPDIADLICNIGSILRHQKMSEEALQKFNEALDMYEKIYKTEIHVDIGDVLWNVGGTLFDQGKLIEAEVVYQRCLGIYIAVFGDRNHPKVIRLQEVVTNFHKLLP